MKKIFLTLVIFLNFTSLWSQRGQVIGYIDMDYILENVPEYLEAQNTLDSKIAKWKKKLDKQARHIEVLKTDLANEKAILTKDLIEEKEEEITLKQQELRRLESLYFGPKGDLFFVRKQLVKPIQDQVYNAIQSIAKRRKFDFIFDKTSDLVMLYSNKKYDISELVLSTIKKTRLVADKKKKIKKKNTTAPKKQLNQKQKEVVKKKEDVRAKKLAEIEAKKKQIAEKRALLIKQRDEKRKILLERKEALRKKKLEATKNKNNN